MYLQLQETLEEWSRKMGQLLLYSLGSSRKPVFPSLPTQYLLSVY